MYQRRRKIMIFLIIPITQAKRYISRIPMKKCHSMMINIIRNTVTITTTLWMIMIMMIVCLIMRKKCLYQEIIDRAVIKTNPFQMMTTLIRIITLRININKEPPSQINIIITTKTLMANHLKTFQKTFSMVTLKQKHMLEARLLSPIILIKKTCKWGCLNFPP